MTANATLTTAARPDTSEMIVIHNVFRRLFGDLPGLLRAAPPGDRARAAVLADAWTEVATGLHHHHTNEDEILLAPRARGPRRGRAQLLVLRAEEQHERVHELLELGRCRSSGSAPARRPSARRVRRHRPPSCSPRCASTWPTRSATSCRWSSST